MKPKNVILEFDNGQTVQISDIKQEWLLDFIELATTVAKAKLNMGKHGKVYSVEEFIKEINKIK